MKKALISPNEVLGGFHRISDIVEDEFVVAPPLFWMDCSDDITTDNHVYDPTTDALIAKEIVNDNTLVLLMQEIETNKLSNAINSYELATSRRLDNVAKEWKYDSMTEVATYLTSKVAKFKAEAETLIAWRDSTWESCYSTIAKIEAGTTGAPTNLEEFLATLPAVPTKL